MIRSSPKLTVDEITATATVQPSTSAGTSPFFYQCQVGAVNISLIPIKTAGSLSRNSLKHGELLLVTVTKANEKF